MIKAFYKISQMRKRAGKLISNNNTNHNPLRNQPFAFLLKFSYNPDGTPLAIKLKLVNNKEAIKN